MRRSESFLVLKEHSQSILDFSVLVCTAVPQLRHALNQYNQDPSTYLAKNSHFRESNEPYATEKRTMAKYKSIQGANILLSVFAFFETYFFSMIDELLKFHGGNDEFINFIKRKVSKSVIFNYDEDKHFAKINKKYDPAKADRYRNSTKIIEAKGFVWPSQKLALYGAQQIIANRKRWRSNDIPHLVNNLLVYNLDESKESRFHNIRDTRNKIAHGKRLSFDLDDALDVNYFLYNLSKEIDEHVVKNFFVIEKFR